MVQPTDDEGGCFGGSNADFVEYHDGAERYGTYYKLFVVVASVEERGSFASTSRWRRAQRRLWKDTMLLAPQLALAFYCNGSSSDQLAKAKRKTNKPPPRSMKDKKEGWLHNRNRLANPSKKGKPMSRASSYCSVQQLLVVLQFTYRE